MERLRDCINFQILGSYYNRYLRSFGQFCVLIWIALNKGKSLKNYRLHKLIRVEALKINGRFL